MAKLIGIKVITTSAGNKGYIYHMADAFNEFEQERAECFGNQVFSEYTSKIFKVNVGDEVQLFYEKGYQGQAKLSNMIVTSEGKLSNK